MYPKALLVAIAAFTLMAPGAYAFSGEVLARAAVTESQRAALSVAKELRAEGDFDGAVDILVEAGIDEEVLERIRAAHASLQYSYWQESPDASDILSEDEQAAYRAAQAANDRDTMDAILEAAGVIDEVLYHKHAHRLRDGKMMSQ